MNISHTTNSGMDFIEFRSQINKNFKAAVAEYGSKILHVSTVGLWEAYLSSFPSATLRQEHNCSCCKAFIDNYGGLVRIDEQGNAISLLWEGITGEFADVAAGMVNTLSPTVLGVFCTNKTTLGIVSAGGWNHFAVELPEMVRTKGHKKPHEVAAEYKEEYRMVQRGLTEFKEELVDKAIFLLDSDSLYRSEKVSGVARWLKKLHGIRKDVKHSANKVNLLWKEIASAPKGYAHIKSSMIGSLLEDLSSEMDIETVASRFATKMQPYNYLRPKAQPNTGNIEQAEKLIEALGLRDSFRRRMARLEDIETLWLPTQDSQIIEQGGLFDILREDKQNKGVDVTAAKDISMEKFLANVLPTAKKIEVKVTHKRMSFVGYTTEAVAGAKCLFQWNNPVSVYFYNGGSLASDWNLSTGYMEATAISLRPNEWPAATPSNQGNGVSFILKDARDKQTPGLAIFPETLKSELHSVRKTIEAFSNKGKMEGVDEATACGIMLGEKSKPLTVRVHVDGGSLVYNINRWD